MSKVKVPTVAVFGLKKEFKSPPSPRIFMMIYRKKRKTGATKERPRRFLSHFWNWFPWGNVIEIKANGEMIIRNQNPIIRPMKTTATWKNANAAKMLTRVPITNRTVISIADNFVSAVIFINVCGWKYVAME